MGKKQTRRLREGDFAFEPTEKPNTRRVVCYVCGDEVERKRAIRSGGKWFCPDCVEEVHTNEF